MFYVSIFSIPDIPDVKAGGILAAFVMGGLSIIAVQGGIGVYPGAVAGILLLYGVSFSLGNAFGWVIWTAQTLIIIVVGALSQIMMPIYNKKRITDGCNICSLSIFIIPCS